MKEMNNIKKGQTVKVRFTLFVNKPIIDVEAYNDSCEYDGQVSFSYLMGGDMMMIAKWNGTEWITN